RRAKTSGAGSDEDGNRRRIARGRRHRETELRAGGDGGGRTASDRPSSGDERMKMDFASLRAAYQSGEAKPADVIASIYDQIEKGPLNPVWISLVPRKKALAHAREADPQKPLYGIPFAIKDNIDLAGVPTTAGCPAYSYDPQRSATVVQRLVD